MVRTFSGVSRTQSATRCEPVLVVAAAAEPGVEQPAADARPVDLAGILVLELGHAAFAAAVAERFPLGRAHRLERLGFPEGFVHGERFDPDGAAGQAHARRPAASTAWESTAPARQRPQSRRCGTNCGVKGLGGDGTFHSGESSMKRQTWLLAGTALGLLMAAAPAASAAQPANQPTLHATARRRLAAARPGRN